VEQAVERVVEHVVLVGHNPITVFTTTDDYLSRLKKKPDGHYNREDLMTLVRQGHAAMHDERTVNAVLAALKVLIWGCPPL